MGGMSGEKVMTKVYITYEKDGEGGEQVEKVFATESAAQDFVIVDLKKRSLIGNMEKHELEEKALEYITSHRVW